MTGIGQAHFMLTAEPADNPNQPPSDQQGDHHPGSHAEVERIRKLLKAPEPAAETLIHGDVVFDYSQVPVSDAFNAQLKAAKCVAVSRYYSPLNADGSDYGPTFVKVIQVPEYKWHLANGRWVFKNYEWYETRMNEGAAAGTQDAYWAGTKGWRNDQAVGIDPLNPANEWARWITFSDDQGASAYANVKAYMLAAYAQLQKMPGKYLPNYYGRQAIWEQLLKDPDIHWLPWGWQTCAWSGGVFGGDAGMYQAICAPVSPNIAGCDTNFIMKTLFVGGDDVTPAEMDTIVKRVGAAMDHRLVRIIAWLCGFSPSGNMYVSDTWDIPAEGPFPAATDAWTFFNDPKVITIDEVQRGLGLLLYGDSKYAATGTVDPATGKIPPQGHPFNLYQMWQTIGSARDFPSILQHGDIAHPNSLDAIAGKVADIPDATTVTAAATAGVSAVLPLVDQAIKEAVNAAVQAAAPDLPGVVKDTITKAVGDNLGALKLDVTLAGNAATSPAAPTPPA